MYKVLIIDDEPYIVEGIKHIINWEEYGVELLGTASNGIEALNLIIKTPPDLLITDIKMPRMNGLELIKKVKELKLKTRFIILSGYDDFGYLKESIKLGIENYLLKPINSQEFEETIVNLMNKLQDSALEDSCLNKDINIIKNNILQRWVTDSISHNELIERASLLSIPLYSSQYIAAVLRLIPGINSDIDLFSITQKAEEICSKIINSGLVFINHENNLVFIMNETEAYTDLTKYCLSNLQKELDINFFFTIGSIENDYALVSRSYDKAMELQQYSLIMPFNNVLDFNNSQRSVLDNEINERISYNEISKYILSKDLASLISYIDNTFSALTKKIDLTPAYIKNTAAELLFCIINCARRSLESKKISIYELGYPLTNIYKTDNLDKLFEFIKSTAKRLINLSIEENPCLNPMIKRILDCINLDYSNDLSLKTLAIELNTNSNYLGQLFKEETGEYFSDYVNRIRINKAKELLLTSDRNTKDISSDVGYKDVNYFYRAFKKYEGISPSEFRSI